MHRDYRISFLIEDGTSFGISRIQHPLISFCYFSAAVTFARMYTTTENKASSWNDWLASKQASYALNRLYQSKFYA